MTSAPLRHLRVFALLCGLGVFALHGFAADNPRVFRAGAATSNITPKLGTSINGNMSDGKATHVHDELHSRALVLDDGTTKLAIVVNDSCMIPREVFDEAKRLGVEVEWVTPDWAAITAGNWAGRWDISIGSMTQTEERALVVDFLDPYFYEAGYLLVATDSPYTSVADLAGKTICAGESTTHATWIEGGFAGSTVVDVFNQAPEGAVLKTYPTDYNCIEAFLAGRTDDWDAMAQSREFIENAIANSDGKLKFLSEEANFAGRISFALDKSGPDDRSMLSALNEIVAAMHEDGTLSGFSMTHLGRDVTKP